MGRFSDEAIPLVHMRLRFDQEDSDSFVRMSTVVGYFYPNFEGELKIFLAGTGFIKRAQSVTVAEAIDRKVLAIKRDDKGQPYPDCSGKDRFSVNTGGTS